MNKKTMYIIFVIAVIIILSLIIFSDKNIEVKQDKLDQQNNASTTVNTGNVENSVKVNGGENFEINLESNPTTGYSWVAKFDENLIELVNKDFVQKNNDKQIVGAGATEIFKFKALKTGETKINFYYLREWEIDVAPIDQKVFDVVIK